MDKESKNLKKELAWEYTKQVLKFATRVCTIILVGKVINDIYEMGVEDGMRRVK